MITNDERFIKIQGILSFSDIHPSDCNKINSLIIELSKENEMLHHYKTLYQSLKKQKEEMRKYFNERIDACDNRLSSPFCDFKKATKERLIFSQCLEKLEELEGLKDD